ncbi:MAG: hypothetical protein ABNH42_04475 [Marinobacter sp.]|jgi:hypothetical protein
MALKTVPFNVAFTFSRPNPADYEDINGDTQTAGTDVPRFNYSEGVGEGLMLDASLSETAAINDIPNFNSSSGTWVIKADLDKSIPIPGSGFGEFMEGSGTLVFVYSNGVGKCWADGQVLFTVDPFPSAEPGFLSNGGLAKIQDLTYYPYAWTDEDAAAKSGGAFATYFTPVKLFSGGEQGAWYDPSDTSTLFQDSAGTIPVTADGDPVGLIMDKSGNDNHASQNTGLAKPIYRTDGQLHWLEFDGSDDSLETSSIFTNQYGMSIAAGFLYETVGGSATQAVAGFQFGTSYSILATRTGNGRLTIQNRFSGGPVSSVQIDDAFTPADKVSSVCWQDESNLSLSASINGEASFSETVAQESAEATSSVPFVMGNSLGHVFRVYGSLGIDRKMTEEEVNSMIDYQNDKVGF